MNPYRPETTKTRRSASYGTKLRDPVKGIDTTIYFVEFFFI